MDVTPYVERLRHDLTQAAATGDDAARAAAERLASTLDSAVRLTLMEALSEATAEITADMRSGSVEVRLAGRDLDFVLSEPVPTPQAPPAPPSPPGKETEDDDGATARITLRLPEALKAKVDEYAAKAEQSVNTWVVGILRQATRDHAVTVDIDLSSVPFLDRDPPGVRRQGHRRMSGWV